jgi:hypothetical protein
MRRIVISHLTRMRQGCICVAGCDPVSLEHVRLVQRDGQMGLDLLSRNGGPFDMAVLVEFVSEPRPVPPEVEDHVVDPRRVRCIERLSTPDFWTILEEVSRSRLREIFGPELAKVGKSSCCVDVKKGSASLGCFRPLLRPVLYLEKTDRGRNRLRMMITDDDFDLDLPVTDLRFHQEDGATPDAEKIEDARQRLRGREKVLLSVGLTRPFASGADRPPVHWLQVNNLHFENDPVWGI